MWKSKRIIGVVLLILENIVIVAIFFGALLYLNWSITENSKNLERDGISANSRARAPYVMFRPRRNLSPKTFDPNVMFSNDWEGLYAILKAADNNPKPTPGLKVLENIPLILRKKIAHGISEENKQAITDALNQILSLPDFYDEKYHADLYIPNKYFKLINSKNEEESRIALYHLNRILLESTFPDIFGDKIRINSWGFNSPEITKDKRENEYRIAMIGGSVVWRSSLHKWTAAGQLAQVLREREPSLAGKNITYINAGIPSAVSGQELAQLIWHVLPMDIDLLVIFDGYNDFLIPFTYERRPGYPYDYVIEEYRFYNFQREHNALSGLRSLISQPLQLIDENRGLLDYYEQLGITIAPDDERARETFDIYFNNAKMMTDIAAINGIKTAVFLQPYSTERNDPEHPIFGILVDLYKKAGAPFAELAKKNSPSLIYSDISDIRFEMEDLFIDQMHFDSEKGNRLVAERMYKIMKENRMFVSAD